jgi:hypothetical protein
MDGNTKVGHYASCGAATRDLQPAIDMRFGAANDRAADLHARNQLTLQHLVGDGGTATQTVCSAEVRCARPLVPHKPAGVDVCGVVGTVCHHVVPVRGGFVDLLTYESFSYYIVLLDDLLQKLPNVGHVFVDFACKLGISWGRHLVRLFAPGGTLADKPGLQERFGQVRLLVNWLHAEGHTLECQLKHSGRHTDGTGRKHGEGTEQLWALAKVGIRLCLQVALPALNIALLMLLELHQRSHPTVWWLLVILCFVGRCRIGSLHDVGKPA